MPISDYLREEFEDDQAAFDAIDNNFTTSLAGIISPIVAGYTPTEKEGRALDYLCQEWDYGYHA